ncbi:MAG: aminopeptidase [Bacteroidales bacterium]|nr:aminopeptidase [Bacteroidales bacterium]
MRNSYSILIVLASWLILVQAGKAQQLETFLSAHKEITSFEKLTGDSPFQEVWKVMIRQPLDHSDTTHGFFQQRIFVAERDAGKHVVFVTEGYTGGYAARTSYENELSQILDANQIVVEHRYFGKSVPDTINWDYLTVENAAADHHEIIDLFDDYYTGKWISTGISKGGQTALYHLTFYPDDVDISVPYVAPLNYSVEDGRHEIFIDHVATPESRKRVRDFQIEVLKRREQLMPEFEQYIREKGLEYRIPIDAVYDYCVLEYSFSFWQWGSAVESIPGKEASDSLICNHLMAVSGPEYFAINGMESIRPFFVQAAKELGYYGYDTKSFEPWLTIKNAKGYLSSVMLPEGMKIRFNHRTNKKVFKFIRKKDPKMIFIYGEYDPWSASGVVFEHKNNMLKIVKPAGSHATRINNLPDQLHELVVDTLLKWTKDEIEIRNTKS